ncbi:hypothetical protein BH18ACI4_BH18ACI4_19140 [soil metagenome]
MTSYTKPSDKMIMQVLPSVSRAAVSSFYAAAAIALLSLVASLGTRWGWWPFRIGFILMLGVMLGAVVAIVLAIIGLISARRRGLGRSFVWATLGLLITLMVVALPLNLVVNGLRLPPIHDISTDTENPPTFVAILHLRKDADNPSAYGGPEVAAQQHKAYPTVAPLTINLPPNQAFERALGVARDMGWEIVEANPTEGRLEATAKTFWFGFKDDVIVRITASGGGSRIDVRSVSRVGTSDVGANAKRIEKYLGKISQSE